MWPFSAYADSKERIILLMIYKLRKNAEFRIVYRRGKSFANNLLVLYVFIIKKIRMIIIFLIIK